MRPRPESADSMRSSRGSSTSGRYSLFSRSASSWRHCSGVRVCSVVRKPPRASRTATAVPNEPAPTTTARRLPGVGSARCGRGGIPHPYPSPGAALRAPLGQLPAERLARRLELLERGRLERALEVDDALAERVERVRADDGVQRDAGLPGAGADLAHELALERLLVELALARDDRARGAHALVEV